MNMVAYFERRERRGSYPKIFENQQIPKKSILQSWYSHSSISHAHGSNKRPKINSGDSYTAEIANLHEYEFELWVPTWDLKVVIAHAAGRFPK